MAKLQEIRNVKGLSQGGLAKEAGVNVRVIQHYEQGFRDINGAKLVTLLKLCNALDCRLSDILDDPETLERLSRYESR